MSKDNQLNVIRTARPGSVRLISETGEQLGVMSIADALSLAQEKGFDLIEVAPQAKPPVCKFMDYGKLKYEQSKKAKPSKGVSRKEIRMSIRIEQNDLNTKLGQAVKFLKKGQEVQVTVMLKGREKSQPEIATEVLNRFMEELLQRIETVRIVKDVHNSGTRAEVIVGKA